ncbi:MAG TPA: hypothetical protein VM141_08265 [Planctomycetota bacterium]|nr:hypothetical protein [Planctomycetota bacterium]
MGTAFTSSSTICTEPAPSASAAKFGTTRCRSTLTAQARTSSVET